MTVGPDSDIWFTLSGSDHVGKLTGLLSAYVRYDDICSCQVDVRPSLNTGDLHLHAALDPGAGAAAGAGLRPDTALEYHSDTVTVYPIVEVHYETDPNGAIPTQLQAQLTWNNGTAQGWVTFTTTGHSAGDTYVLDAQSTTLVTATGTYPFQVEVLATYPGGDVIDRTYTGDAYVVANGTSDSLGNGWGLDGLDQLVPDGSNGVLWVYGGNVRRYFSAPGSGSTYVSPANDFGTLVQNGDGSWTYTGPDDVTRSFNSGGQLTSVMDAHGLSVAYAYSNGLLSTVTDPNGDVTTFSYDGNGRLATVAEPGGRVVTVSHSTGGDLTALVTPDGALRTFSYDGSHRLTNDQRGPFSTTYTYDASHYTLSGRNLGLGSVESYTPANIQGFASPAVSLPQVVGVRTDALGVPTTYTLDLLNRPLQQKNADGGVQTWKRDFAGQVTVVTDPMGRATQYAYDYGPGLGSLVKVTNPDGSAQTYQYAGTYPLLMASTDTLNHTTSYSYDGQRDLLTTTNALNQTTTQTWSSGLLQSATDPLGNTATYQYDTKRRLLDTVDALGDRTTYAYDAANNQTTVTDALGRSTTTAYDGMRRALSVTDAVGGVATMAYDAAGNLTSQTDPLGHVTQYQYDARGWQTAVTEAVGTPVQRTTTTGYDLDGRATTQTDALNHTTTYSYDVMGRQRTATSAVGGVQTSAYDLDGEMIAQTDALNHTTTYSYDNRGRQYQVTDALNDVTTTLYDTEGNTLATIDARGNRTTFAYDALNRVTQTTDALGDVTTVVYDVAGNTLATVDARGNRTTFAYDALNRQTQVTDALGDVATTLYDAVGNTQATIDPLGNRSTFTYDPLNRRLTTTDPLGLVTSTTYDLAGNVLTQTNPRGYTTTFAYDALNRRTQTTDAAGNLATVVYDAGGNALATVDARGNRTSFSYDAASRQVSQTDALNHTTSTVYDLGGNVVRSIDALGNATTMAYDALNRQVTVQDPGGGVTTTLYDANGNTVNTIDPLGHKGTFVYDALNRRTLSIDALGDTTTTAYDANGNQVNVIDPVGNKTTFVYDALNRQAQQTDPLGHSSTFAYDAAGRQTSTTDRLGRVRNLTYDADSRLTTEVWLTSGTAVNTLTYSYDADGNKLTAANVNGAYTFTYDALDRPATQQGPFSTALTFAYDATSNRTLVQDSFGGTLTSVYNPVNLLSSRQFGGSGQTTLRFDLSYTPRNQVATMVRYTDLQATNKVGESDYTYDGVGRLTNKQDHYAGGTVFANYTYTYDQASRVLTQTLNGGTATYGYDAINQLTSDTSSAAGTFSYDANGNRNMTGYQTSTGNELTNDGTWTYTYDAEGNLSKKSKGSLAETWTYGYDHLNRLIWAEDRLTDGGTLIQRLDFKYDVFGNRLEKDETTLTTTVTRFAYDGQDVWADLNGSNALVMRRLFLDGVDQPFARVDASGNAAWYLVDRLASIRDVVNYAGTQVLDHVDYDGYGNVTSETAPSSGDRYKYTGREFDSETGLEYNRARYYDPKIGRWTSQDPTGFDGGDASLYRYVGNEPTDAIDPSGLVEVKQLATGEFDDGTTVFLGGVAKNLLTYQAGPLIIGEFGPGSMEKTVDLAGLIEDIKRANDGKVVPITADIFNGLSVRIQARFTDDAKGRCYYWYQEIIVSPHGKNMALLPPRQRRHDDGGKRYPEQEYNDKVLELFDQIGLSEDYPLPAGYRSIDQQKGTITFKPAEEDFYKQLVKATNEKHGSNESVVIFRLFSHLMYSKDGVAVDKGVWDWGARISWEKKGDSYEPVIYFADPEWKRAGAKK